MVPVMVSLLPWVWARCRRAIERAQAGTRTRIRPLRSTRGLRGRVDVPRAPSRSRTAASRPIRALDLIQQGGDRTRLFRSRRVAWLSCRNEWPLVKSQMVAGEPAEETTVGLAIPLAAPALLTACGGVARDTHPCTLMGTPAGSGSRSTLNWRTGWPKRHLLPAGTPHTRSACCSCGRPGRRYRRPRMWCTMGSTAYRSEEASWLTQWSSAPCAISAL